MNIKKFIEEIKNLNRYELGGYPNEESVGAYMEKDSEGEYIKLEDIIKLLNK